MRIIYDKEANAMYIYLDNILKNKSARTILISNSVNLDLNSKGKVVGIEVLNVL